MKLSAAALTLFALCVSDANAAKMMSGEIPVITIDDPILNWSPVTYLSVPGGSSNIPVLIDTGSSLISLCNTTDIGDIAVAAGVYGCAAYGSYPGPANGWIGEFYNTPLTFGDGKETVADPRNVSVVLMDTQNTDLCTPNIHGIVGVDLGADYFYYEPQLLPAPGNCNYTAEGSDCCSKGNYSALNSQFGESMITGEDLYTFALIGLAPWRNSSDSATTSVMAFGETAREKVEDSNSAGSASFASSEDSWYTFADNVTFAVTGYTEGDNCTSYFGTEDCATSAANVIIDSGTQPLVLPVDGLPENFTSLVIVVESVELEFSYDFLDYLYSLNLLEFAGPGTATLGFPVFWAYDVLFDVNMDKIETLGRYGDVTFYERPDAEEEDLMMTAAPSEEADDVSVEKEEMMTAAPTEETDTSVEKTAEANQEKGTSGESSSTNQMNVADEVSTLASAAQSTCAVASLLVALVAALFLIP